MPKRPRKPPKCSCGSVREPAVSRDEPIVEYDPDGDQIEVILTDDSYYGEFVNGRLTLYRSQATNKVMGFVVSGVRRMVEG